MAQSFADLLQEGKPNSLGRVPEVIESVLAEQNRLQQLYDCLFLENAWARMRAADALEKICRVHPEWLEPYIDRLQNDFSTHTQPSIQWHMAQVFTQVRLTTPQKKRAVDWITARLQDKNVDWIVAANCMDTLVHFVNSGDIDKTTSVTLIKQQRNHKSNAVKRRADKVLASLGE